jgi:thiol:disulfide interchange protein
MSRLLRLLLPVCLAWASWAGVPLAASPQSSVKGELFAREVGGGWTRVAVRISVPSGFHVYHEDLGPPDAVGKPTTLKFEGLEDVSKPFFPKPIRHEQPGAGADGRDTWIWTHEGVFTVHALGRLVEGGKLEAVASRIAGLVCDEVGCTPFKARAEFAGAGPDELFAAFPAELRPPGAETGSAGSSAPVPEGRDGQVKGRLFARVEGSEARALIELEVADGFYVYHDQLEGTDADGLPTEVTLAGAGVQWERARFPSYEEKLVKGITADGGDASTRIHSGKLLVSVAGRVSGTPDLSSLKAKVEGQFCNDVGCTPFAFEIPFGGRGQDAAFAAALAAGGATTPVTSGAPAGSTKGGVQPESGSTSGTEEPARSLGAFLLAAFFGALFALVMPCTYPMIPITISFFSKQAGTQPHKRVELALLYGLGIILIFILIGVVVGPVIVRFANAPWTNLIIGVLFVIFALSLFGLFELRPPRFLMGAAGQARQTGGTLGVFLMGATLVITSFTCTAPFVGSLLSYGAGQSSLLRIVLGMGVFGLTMALPFVALALVPGKLQSMPKGGEWMHTFKVFMGFVELAAAMKFISNADLVWQWQILNRELFLVLWCGIFAVAGLFLLGFVKLEGESGEGIGPTRLVSGTAVISFALYCGWGALGNEMDRTMTAIVPNYSAGVVSGHAKRGGAVQDHEIVVDNYAQALGRAKSAGRYLLINFTGFN